MMNLLKKYKFENMKIGTSEIIDLLRAASTSEQYRGITYYSFIAYPNKKEFALAVEDLEKKTLDASFCQFIQFTFEEVFN